ncbi:MAG: hypothetical protein NEA02_07600, partial [Thermoanaerobaculia bacterium]|nr:hypothetical protein [Thermoanaerobaculia bacterium]
GFLVWADDDVATTLVFAGGQLRFARTRSFTDPLEAVQDIRLAVTFGLPARAPDAPPVDVTAVCAAGPAASPVVGALRAFRAGAGAQEPELLTQVRLAPGATLMPAAAADEPSTLAALGTLAGGD